MILKFLLIVVVISIVYFMFIKKKPTTNEKSDKNRKANADEMVECANCGVYAELQECILSNGKYYCSKECLKEAK